MLRITEPELMADPTQARAYAEADFESAHQSFIRLFHTKFSRLDFIPDINRQVLDLGCGPCDITRRFVRAFPHAYLHAVDGAPAMLQEAARLNRQHKLADRITLIESDLARLCLPQQHYHTIISNSLLHHLHDPHILWDSIKNHAKPFANIFLMDLIRPESETMAMQLVEQYAIDAPEILRHDFYHSLCAAFRPDEVQTQLEESALTQLAVETVSDRHMIIYGTI